MRACVRVCARASVCVCFLLVCLFVLFYVVRLRNYAACRSCLGLALLGDLLKLADKVRYLGEQTIDAIMTAVTTVTNSVTSSRSHGRFHVTASLTGADGFVQARH